MAIGRRRPVVDPRKAGSVEAALRRALRAAVGGDRPSAETWLERIVEADSADLDAYHALARLYREQGDIGRAIRMHQNLLLRAGLSKAEKNEALLELARDFDDGGFSERAIASYEEVLDAQPREAEALEAEMEEHAEESQRLEFLTEQRSDLVEARDDLRRAIRETLGALEAARRTGASPRHPPGRTHHPATALHR